MHYQKTVSRDKPSKKPDPQPSLYTKPPPHQQVKKVPGTNQKVIVPVYPTIPTYEQWELGRKKKKDLDTQFISSNTFMNILQELAGLNTKVGGKFSMFTGE